MVFVCLSKCQNVSTCYNFYKIQIRSCNSKINYEIARKPAGYWDKQENIENFLLFLKEKLKLRTINDWNKISNKDIRDNGARSLLKTKTVYDIKCIGCPEGKLKFNKPNKEIRYWENKENVNNFIDDIKEKLNLKTFDDWQSKLTKEQIEINGGKGILNKYSIYEIRKMGFPSGKLQFSKPNNFWDKIENTNDFLIEFKEKYNLKTIEDWNSITIEQICSFGGRSLLRKYSLYEIKCLGCPEGKLVFNAKKELRYWENKKNLDDFFTKLKEKFNLKTPEDWNLITSKQIGLFANSLLNVYSLYEIKCMGCPEGRFLFDKPIEKKPRGFWNQQENIQNFLNVLAYNLQLKTPDDWNLLTRKLIIENGGSGLLKIHSIHEIKCFGCPEGKSIYSLPKKSTGYWENENNIKNFLFHLKQKLNLQTPGDWNRISTSQIGFNGGYGLLSKFTKKEIIEKLKNTFDDTTHCKSSTNFSGRSSQRWLFLLIQKLFPNEEIVEDYFHSEISRISGVTIQFDVFLVNKNIAFEYHGQQHYDDIPSAFATVEMYKNRDKEKALLCKKFGVTLIVIPYWWNNREDSLRNTINSTLPGIIK